MEGFESAAGGACTAGVILRFQDDAPPKVVILSAAKNLSRRIFLAVFELGVILRLLPKDLSEAFPEGAWRGW
jgi:hypothetical protein